MTQATRAAFECLDGLFFAPLDYLEALRQEREEGGLTVTRAARLCEEWRKAAGRRR